MNLRKLRHILALHEEGSFIRAAERVHLSQSALSRSVQALEDDLGLLLFDRTRDGVVATAAGKQFVMRARQVEHVLSDFRHDMLALRGGVTGRISFGVGPFPANAFLAAALEQIACACPKLQVAVHIDNAPTLVEDLKAERIEFFIGDVRALAHERDIEISPFGDEAAIVTCRSAHPLAGAAVLEAAQLAQFGFASVHLPPPAQLPAGLAPLLQSNGGPWTQLLNCDNLDILKRVVLQSDMLLLSTRAVVRGELARGELVELGLPGIPAMGIRMSVVTLRERTLSPAAQQVLVQLRAASLASETSIQAEGQ